MNTKHVHYISVSTRKVVNKMTLSLMTLSVMTYSRRRHYFVTSMEFVSFLQHFSYFSLVSFIIVHRPAIEKYQLWCNNSTATVARGKGQALEYDTNWLFYKYTRCGGTCGYAGNMKVINTNTLQCFETCLFSKSFQKWKANLNTEKELIVFQKIFLWESVYTFVAK